MTKSEGIKVEEGNVVWYKETSYVVIAMKYGVAYMRALGNTNSLYVNRDCMAKVCNIPYILAESEKQYYDICRDHSRWVNMMRELDNKAKPRYNRDTSWKERFLRAAKTAEIDYGCDFENGKCKAMKSSEVMWQNRSPMGCCAHCRTNHGYLESIPKSRLDEVKKLFNSTTGFWREGIGCSLPRELRSDTCLSFACKPNDPEFSYKVVAFLRTGKGFDTLKKKGDCTVKTT